MRAIVSQLRGRAWRVQNAFDDLGEFGKLRRGLDQKAVISASILTSSTAIVFDIRA